MEHEIKVRDLEEKLSNIQNEMVNEESISSEESQKYKDLESKIKNLISMASFKTLAISQNNDNNDKKSNLRKIKSKEQTELDEHNSETAKQDKSTSKDIMLLLKNISG